jgi:signal transduction histidine kinase/ActR/RegA family two-component response regulator
MLRIRRPLSLRNQAWLILAIPVVAALLAQAVPAYHDREATRIERQIHQLEDWQRETQALSTSVVTAESALRGYRLSGGTDAALLEQYEQARREVVRALESVEKFAPNRGSQAQHFARLEFLVPRRLELLEEFRRTPVAVMAGSPLAIRAVARGKALSEQINSEIAYFRGLQERLSADHERRLAEMEQVRDFANVAFPLALLLGFAVAGVQSSRLIRRIELIRRNTRRLAHGEALEPMAPGGGELMSLQTSIQDTAVLLDARTREGEVARLEAERANQAKTAFLSRMSHELRTPLTAVLGFAELLDLDDLEDSQRESVRHIRNAGRHLLTLINEVLDISRIESGHLAVSNEPLELGPVIADAVTLIRPMAEERGIRVSADSPQWLYAKADRQRLTQVLLNLLSNAVKYNRDYGAITVTCTVRDGWVSLAVSDTGMGIAPGLLPRVFNPFDRLGAEQTSIEGTGVGLTLSKGLVEVMGGTMAVESEPGVGTTFTVELALAANGEKAVHIPDAVDSDAPDEAMPPVTVLYVEDNAANIDLVAGLLARRPGVRLITTMQGRLAMDLARTHRPQLVLLDLHLPDFDGEEVLRRLRQDPETADLLVAMLTADATPGQERRLRALGADDFLTKPLDFGKVGGLLRRAAYGVVR